jgi:hypothetical protein
MNYNDRWDAFKAFHNSHPNIYPQLVGMAFQMLEVGRPHWLMSNLWEVMKFRLAHNRLLDVSDMLDEYIPFYAELIMKRNPELRCWLWANDLPLDQLIMEQLA